MGWEPLPPDVAEWMGMDDDHLRPEAAADYDLPQAKPRRPHVVPIARGRSL